jgi:hypothetical protein
MNEDHDDGSITEHPDGRLTLTYGGREATVSPIPPSWPDLMCAADTCIRVATWTPCHEPDTCGSNFPCRQLVACDDHGPAQLAVHAWSFLHADPTVTLLSVEDERAEYGGHD